MRNRPERPDLTRNLHWERGWEEHQTMQLKRMAGLSLPEKIAWLEEAHRLVLHLKGGKTEPYRKPG